MKILNERAFQIYHVSPEYRRFDQKFNMTRRHLWDLFEFGDKYRVQTRLDRLKKLAPGYGLQDWALHQAGESTHKIARTDMNVPNRGHSSWSGSYAGLPPGLERMVEDPARMSQRIKRVARLYGADLVGMTKLDRRWVYSRWFDEETKESYPILFSDETGQPSPVPSVREDRTQIIPKEMEYAIVMGLGMNQEGMGAAPALTEMATTYIAYAKLGFLSFIVAEFIRGLGYNAIPMINDTALSIPLAIDAGLGQAGRHGLLITPQFGPRCRICKVLTDLPLGANRPIDFGVTAFCGVCKKCADHCPGGAISKKARSHEAGSVSSNRGVLKWEFNAEKCRRYQTEATGTNCGICIRVCPYNKSRHWIHSAVRWSIDNLPVSNPFWVRVDDAFSYGKFRDPEKVFWGE
jgi:epoxyqueuosine reductase